MNPDSYTHEPKFLLVKDGTALPPDLKKESTGFLPGWRIVKNFDNHSLRQRMRETNWSLLQLRGGKEKRVMGRGRQQILRRGVMQILGELKGKRFNSLEITVVGSKSFFGMLFLNIAVIPRHFQHSTS
jgi:hypothetical protein